MGALTDYFRAVDAASVVEELKRADGGSPLSAGPPSSMGWRPSTWIRPLSWRC